MNEIDVVALSALSPAPVIVDVREDDEYEHIRVEGTVSIPTSRFLEQIGDLPDAEPLYILCHSGGRSARVTEYLTQNGREAVNVTGGITAWHQAGLPTVSGPVAAS